MDWRLKKKLFHYTIEPYREEKLEDVLQRTVSERPGFERQNMSFPEFCLDQLRFIRASAWAGKLLLLLAFLLVFFGEAEEGNIRGWTAVSVFSPLFFLINARELWEICCPGMSALLMTAKYSLRQALAVRMVFFGLADSMLLLLAALSSAGLGFGTVWQFLLYGTVPYLLMCAGSLAILRGSREESGIYYCGVWAVLLGGLQLGGELADYRIYKEESTGVWIWAGLAALGLVIWQMDKFFKQAGGHGNEIGFGTVNERV